MASVSFAAELFWLWVGEGGEEGCARARGGARASSAATTKRAEHLDIVTAVR